MVMDKSSQNRQNPMSLAGSTENMRMSTIKLKRMQTFDSGYENIVLVDGEEGVDLQFVVENEFFDGEEFHPAIDTEQNPE